MVGIYTHAAAGEPEMLVRIELYRAELAGEAQAQSEIGELVWFGAEDDRARIAASLADLIFPDLIARGILQFR